MSNKAQLQINNTELSTLIETLRGKAAGGDTSVELQEKTVTPTTAIQEVQPDTGYDGLSKVTVNAMPTATQATPSITVSSAGLITATSTQSAGYVAAGAKTATKQLTVQAAQTITPGTSNKTIASGRYLTGTQTIKGDANLVAANIAAGVSIFGVTGTHSGGGTDTSDATATAADIVEGETAYVNGVKLTGTNPYEKTATDTEVNSQATKLAELKTILQSKAAGGSGAAVEMCTVDIGVYMFDKVIYTSGSGLVEDNNVMVASGKELQVQKNTILYAWCETRPDSFVVTGDGYLINSHVGLENNFYVFSITGDCTIDVEDEVVDPFG